MLEFLASFLILLFSFSPAMNTVQNTSFVFEKPQENSPLISTASPSYRPHKLFEEKTSDNEGQKENSNTQLEEQNNEKPDTNKVQAKKKEIEKIIETVSEEGPKYSRSLLLCSENPALCDSSEAEKPLPPTPKPTPLIVNPPAFTSPPEVFPIDPPITPANDPCTCPPGVFCTMAFPCAEENPDF